ncbi:hypothetical protein J7E71_19995 [Mesobacillus foraminis]|uniref:hypothetical protein n=1 Tax=Mesobacillus foraminis TaxID=279826 RepID=UPI001BE71BD4|nr:hypothetical protein [Mesobacillus foraminis]MBT2758152.1 hypothetical protein [Mesobacillus foraminis]
MIDLFPIMSCVGVIIFFVSKYRKTLKKLNKTQIMGVFISYILTAIIAGICIYYGGAFLTERFQNEWIKLIIRFSVVIVTLWLAILTLNHILQKITKGIFPKIT